MHLYPFTMTAFPPSTARTSPSGQTVVHVPQPIQWAASICGCWACGPPESILPFSAASFARFSLFTRFLNNSLSFDQHNGERPLCVLFSYKIGRESSKE